MIMNSKNGHNPHKKLIFYIIFNFNRIKLMTIKKMKNTTGQKRLNANQV